MPGHILLVYQNTV